MLPRLAALGLLFSVSLVLAQDQARLISGPQPGQNLPGSFHPFNLNGKIGKDRYHCIVCEFGLHPVALVFARERSDGKDETLTELIKKLDEAVEKDQDSIFRTAVIFLSPAARSSVTEEKIEEAAKLVAEAEAREALIARLQGRIKNLKHVVVACMPPEGPKEWKIADKAEVTVVLYHKHRVLHNYAVAEGKMTAEDVDRIMTGVAELLGKSKKRVVEKK